MLKLFDSCVEPILLYCCEVWGYENVDILEKVHTKFCKFIFGVSKYSHNMPVYGELGRYPLAIKIKQNGSLLDENIKSSEYKLNKKKKKKKNFINPNRNTFEYKVWCFHSRKKKLQLSM